MISYAFESGPFLILQFLTAYKVAVIGVTVNVISFISDIISSVSVVFNSLSDSDVVSVFSSSVVDIVDSIVSISSDDSEFSVSYSIIEAEVSTVGASVVEVEESVSVVDEFPQDVKTIDEIVNSANSDCLFIVFSPCLLNNLSESLSQ